MSNHLAIATVTATLRRMLQSVVDKDVPGAKVTTVRPDANSGSVPATGVNIFLYQVTPNPSWRNADLPTRNSGGGLMQKPRAALDLHYLLTHYGDEGKLEPQRLLGSVVRALHTRPLLTREAITGTVQDPLFALQGSNLAEEAELVKLTPMPMNLEDLSKLWSVFFQTPYNLSVAYYGTVVFIEPDLEPSIPLPVRKPLVYVDPFRGPVIERVSSADPDEPRILEGSRVQVVGKQLDSPQIRLLLDRQELAGGDLQEVLDTRVSFLMNTALADTIGAGVHGIQVIHIRSMGEPPVEHPRAGTASNLVAFVLHPGIRNTNVAVTNRRDVTTDGQTTTLCTGTITMQLDPKVRKEQRVVLLLDRRGAGGPRSYGFVASARQPDDPVDDVSFPIVDVASGTYLVRVQVDGAESLLVYSDAEGYNSPAVDIS
jgi:hypothetical protein